MLANRHEFTNHKFRGFDESVDSRFTQAQRRDVALIQRHLAGRSIDDAPHSFIGDRNKLILTFRGALHLYNLFGMEITSIQHGRSQSPWAFNAVVIVECDGVSRAGASTSRVSAAVAERLAFRNAVQFFVDK